MQKNMQKGENAGYQQFLLFPQCFERHLVLDPLKSGLCSKGLKYSKFYNEHKISKHEINCLLQQEHRRTWLLSLVYLAPLIPRLLSSNYVFLDTDLLLLSYFLIVYLMFLPVFPSEKQIKGKNNHEQGNA